MRKIQKFVVWVLIVLLCIPVQAMAIGRNSESGDVVAVLVYDGIPYELNSAQVRELELCGLEIFVERNNIPSVPAAGYVGEQAGLMNQPGYINAYYETSGSDVLRYDLAKYVTPEYTGPCQITYGESQTFTSTFSGSLTLQIKLKVIADIGGSYSYSASSSAQISATYTVPEFETARIRFVPRMRHTVGIYSYDSFTNYNVEAYIVKKVNGFADGLYQKVTTGYG